jgi:uncharacterized delta-60 repeat protein
MRLSSLFGKTSSAPRPRRAERARPAARFRPRLEALEDRCLLSAGSLDLTFGSGGIVTTDLGGQHLARAYAVAQQPDGKIIAAGSYYTSGGGQEFAVARYLANGSLDSTFGRGGIVETAISRYGAGISALALQSDGKIVVAGWAQVGQNYGGPGGQTDIAFAAARYNANGSLDTTFGGKKGYVITNPGPADDEARAVAIQPDGSILAAGSSWSGTTSSDFCLVRYTASGALDTSFGGTGIVTTGFESLAPPGYPYTYTVEGATGLILLGNGQILATGQTTHGFALARYNTNGSLDTSYGSSGLVRIGTDSLVPPGSGPGSGNVSSVPAVMQPDGKVVLAGSLFLNAQNSYDVILTARVNGDGSLDSSFGGTGLVTYGTIIDPSQAPTTSEQAAGVGLDPTTGAIVVAGTQVALNSSGGVQGSSFLVLRYTPDGALDATFGTGGVVTTSVSGYDTTSAAALLIESDGSIVVAGSAKKGSDSYFALARYLE